MYGLNSTKRYYSMNFFYWLGSALAAALSYAINQSIGWAILHFFLGWIYVFYVLIMELYTR